MFLKELPRFACALVGVGLLVGCSAEVGTSAGDEGVQSTGEPIQGLTWIGAHSPKATRGGILAISRAPGYVPYVWYDDGWACRGSSDFWQNPDNLCAVAPWTFSSGGRSRSDIRAIGISQSDSLVYTWYNSPDSITGGRVSRGTSDNLTAGWSGDLLPFWPSHLPGTVPALGLFFTMDQLLEADISPNGQCYYYWQRDNVVYLSVGTSQTSDQYQLPRVVTTAPVGDFPIMGISFGGAYVETWYGSGKRNVSTSSLNLFQN